MKKSTWLLAVATTLLLTACIPSVSPFYTEKDIVYEPGLLGVWQEKKSGEGKPDRWRFEADGDKAYKLTVTEEEDKQGEFKAVLFKLGNERFLDLIPTECEYAGNQGELVAACMFPGHLLIHVPQIEPELRLALFDFDWLKKQLEANPNALKHHVEDEFIVLTADTADLQRFVLDHLADGELFDDAAALTRQPIQEPTPPETGQ